MEHSALTNKEFVHNFLKRFFQTCLFFGIAFHGVSIVLEGKFTPYQLSRFVGYARQMSMNVFAVENNIKKVMTRIANAERVFKELDEKPRIDTLAGTHTLKNGLKNEIVLKEVSFAYPHKPDIPILKNINLRIKYGQHIAVVGESGGGKFHFDRLVTETIRSNRR